MTSRIYPEKQPLLKIEEPTVKTKKEKKKKEKKEKKAKKKHKKKRRKTGEEEDEDDDEVREKHDEKTTEEQMVGFVYACDYYCLCKRDRQSKTKILQERAPTSSPPGNMCHIRPKIVEDKQERAHNDAIDVRVGFRQHVSRIKLSLVQVKPFKQPSPAPVGKQQERSRDKLPERTKRRSSGARRTASTDDDDEKPAKRPCTSESPDSKEKGQFSRRASKG